jgi:drug/metabolite transporter (DMT)-like permease
MLCGAVYSIAIRKLSTRYSALVLTSFQAFVGVIFFGPLALQHDMPANIPLFHWANFIYLATIVTIGAYWLYNWAMSKVPVSLAIAYINLIPVLTLLLAFWLLDETLNVQQCLACLAVFAGVVISQLQEKQAESAKEQISEGL